MEKPILEILIIFLLLVFNGIFAMSELAIVSARKARLRQQAEEGSQKARAALALATSPNDFLSTVQIGITLVGILAGAFGGATIAEELADTLRKVHWLAPYSQAVSVGLVVLGITYFSLIIGELVPKRVALNNPEKVAAIVAAPMRALSVIFSPAVRLLSRSTDVVIKLSGLQPSTEPSVTEEEIKVMVEQGAQVGVLEEAEQDMIEGVLRLGSRQVGALMTPRTQVVWISLDDSNEVISHKVITSQHSRFPLAKDDLDNILGIVHTKEILAQILDGQVLDLKSLLSEPVYVPEKMPVLQMLEIFKQQSTHIALVVNEYGGFEGIVTTSDILEGIVGYMPFIGSIAEPKVVQRENGSFLVDGLLNIYEFKEFLNIEKLPDDETGNYQTVAGFVIDQMGKIPSVGQRFTWGKYHFEVVDMDWRRIDKVLVTLINEYNLPENGGIEPRRDA
jgi:putative hemolysin